MKIINNKMTEEAFGKHFKEFYSDYQSVSVEYEDLDKGWFEKPRYIRKIKGVNKNKEKTLEFNISPYEFEMPI